MEDLKKRIAKRCAQEFKNGDFISLGIGLPTLVSNYIPEDIDVTLYSENGFSGLSEKANHDNVDVDIINSGGWYVTVLDRVSYFDTADFFGFVRNGRVAASVLGGMQVSEKGDLANWIAPGQKIAGMGGAMDLVYGSQKVIITMLHTRNGEHKILKECTLPLTAPRCVDMIITEMGVINVTDSGLVLTEYFENYSIDDIKSATGCDLIIPPDIIKLKTKE